MKHLKLSIYILVLGTLLLTLLVFQHFQQDLYDSGYTHQQEDTSVLVMVHWIDIPDEVIQQFEEEYPEIQIKYYKYHYATYENAVDTQVLSEQKIDIMGVREEDYVQGIEDGLYMKLDSRAFLQFYKREVREALQRKADGSEYAVALSSTYFGVWYNRTLFDKCGLSVPKTQEEFLELCRVLKQKGERPLILGARDQKSLFPIGLSEDTDFAEMLLAKDYIGEMSAGLTYQQAFEEFKKGRYAMMPAPDTSVLMCDYEIEKVFEPGVFLIPWGSGEEGSTAVIPADNLTAIYARSEKQREAAMFLNFLSRREIAQLLAQANGWASSVEGCVWEENPYTALWEEIHAAKIWDASAVLRDIEKQEEIQKLLQNFENTESIESGG